MGGFFVAAGGDSQNLLLITARHVVFPSSKASTELFVRKNSCRPLVDVLLLGKHTYDSCLENIMARIGEHSIIIENCDFFFCSFVSSHLPLPSPSSITTSFSTTPSRSVSVSLPPLPMRLLFLQLSSALFYLVWIDGSVVGGVRSCWLIRCLGSSCFFPWPLRALIITAFVDV